MRTQQLADDSQCANGFYCRAGYCVESYWSGKADEDARYRNGWTAGLYPYRAFSDLIDTVWKPYHRYELRGLERIPEGAALYVGNHNGGLLSIDSFLFANEVFRDRGLADVPYGLAHDMVMNFLPAQKFLVRIGGIRANHKSAKAVFSRGEKALVYPGGDVDSMRP